ARDNDYRIIIVITGISKPLFNQSRQRLIREGQLPAQIRVLRNWPRTAARTRNGSAESNSTGASSSTPVDYSTTVTGNCRAAFFGRSSGRTPLLLAGHPGGGSTRPQERRHAHLVLHQAGRRVRLILLPLSPGL